MHNILDIPSLIVPFTPSCFHAWQVLNKKVRSRPSFSKKDETLNKTRDVNSLHDLYPFCDSRLLLSALSCSMFRPIVFHVPPIAFHVPSYRVPCSMCYLKQVLRSFQRWLRSHCPCLCFEFHCFCLSERGRRSGMANCSPNVQGSHYGFQMKWLCTSNVV